MMKRFLTLLSILSAIPIALAPARSAEARVCLPHSAAVANLQRGYGENVAGLGLDGRGKSVIELFVASSGSWTILVTRTDGLSCVAASGNDWTDLPEPLKRADEPS